MASSAKLIHVALALLVGLYMGISLSGFHHHHYPEPSQQVPQGPEAGDSQGLRDELQKLQSELKEWKQKTQKSTTGEASALNKVHELEGDLEDCQAKTSTKREETGQERQLSNPHPVCQHLPQPIPSASALWHQNILQILEATRLPNDGRFNFHDVTAELLQMIAPRLHRSIKTLPHQWASLERAMTVAWDRYNYLQLSTAERQKVAQPPRPLKILVMGGSLLVGTNCRKLLTELGLSFRLPKRDCTWSNRLGQFINAYVGGELVEVTKVAMGGTNTDTGSTIWRYDLIPEHARNPDVVFNAYSTNDMHILTIIEAQSANVSLRDKVFDMTQSYVRQVMHSCHPNQPPPVLVHVDDYLGNEQRKIWDTTELAQGVQVLANYYGFTSISYADVVRDIVYGDTHESWLSANWWDTGKFDREIHPGMGMHIASTWVSVYSLLNLVTTYCSIPPTPSNYNEYEVGAMQLPTLRKDVPQAAGKPKLHPTGLPPLLTKDLLLEDVTRLWQQDAQNFVSCEEEEHHRSKCPFSWVSGLSLQQNNETWIQEYFRNQATEWNGWQLSKDGGKIGFVPFGRQNTSSMLLEFNFPQAIRSVTLFYMKSYGDKWKNSRVHFQTSLTRTNVQLEERFLLGVHDKNTSEMYTEALELSESVPPGTALQVGLQLLGGTMFKLMGLAVCS